MEVRQHLAPPYRLRTRIDRRDRRKYCEYHRDVGHDTEGCYQLKQEIERLVRDGTLARFVRDQRPPRRSPPRPPQAPRALPAPGPGLLPPPPPLRHEERPRSPPVEEIHMLEFAVLDPVEPLQPAKRRRTLDEAPTTSASEAHSPGSPSPSADAVVISLNIDNRLVHRVLVDSGSAVDILYFSAFSRMHLSPDLLSGPSPWVQGFAGEPVPSRGTVYLPVKAGDPPCRVHLSFGFLVVDLPSPYNAILGRPGLLALDATISIRRLTVEFPDPSRDRVPPGRPRRGPPVLQRPSSPLRPTRFIGRWLGCPGRPDRRKRGAPGRICGRSLAWPGRVPHGPDRLGP